MSSEKARHAGQRWFRMGSYRFMARDRTDAIKKAAKAVFEGVEAPLDEYHGAFTAEEVYEAAALGRFEDKGFVFKGGEDDPTL